MADRWKRFVPDRSQRVMAGPADLGISAVYRAKSERHGPRITGLVVSPG